MGGMATSRSDKHVIAAIWIAVLFATGAVADTMSADAGPAAGVLVGLE